MSRTFTGTTIGSYLGNTLSVLINGISNTFSAWIFPTAWGAASGNGPGYIISNDTSPNTGVEVFVTKSSTGGGGTLTGRTHNSKTVSQAVSADSVLVLNRWQYVTYEWNATTRVSQLFVNGVEVPYASQTTGAGTVINQGTFFVGNISSSGTAGGFTGSIDTVSYWNTLLTTVQIMNAMAFHGVSSVLPTNLVNYWPILGTASPEPNSVGGGTSLIVGTGGAPQGANSPGQVSIGGGFYSSVDILHFHKTEIISLNRNHRND